METFYNGDIAAIKWNTPEFGVKAYGYGYDNINRLERAKFAAGAALNTDVDKYSVENITYDANGNILTLGRHNTAAGYIDNLTMTYDGNQLKKAEDSGDLVLGFYDGVDAETEYHYDFNGNMDVDDNKGFTFAYNYLNLPKEIVGGNDTVRYIYDASGAKLSKELVQSGAVSYTDYVGNFVYKDSDLDYISTSEGRITQPTAGTFQYEYFLKDHLDNTRTVFADGNGDGVLADNEVLQENHYYPYGMSIGDLAVDRGADNKLKYNGKELQDDMLNGVKLNLYAYGARYYMPDVPVFTTQDPLGEWFLKQSPYLYAYDNPVRFTDFKGMNAKDKVKRRENRAHRKEQRKAKKEAKKAKPAKHYKLKEVVCTAKRIYKKPAPKKRSVKFGYSFSLPGGGDMTTRFTALHWGGYIDIDLLFAAFGAKSKSPKRTPGPPDIEDVASTVETINDIVDEVSEDGTPDKEIMEESASNNNELIKVDTIWMLDLATANKTDTIMNINDVDFESGDSIFFYISNPGRKGKVTKERK